MNILIDALPSELDGRAIDTNFRTWILFEQLMLDPVLTPYQKGVQALKLVYKEDPKSTTADARDPLLWFYRCGEPERRRTRKRGGSAKRVFDYDADANRIYAAFLAVYRIDLNAVEELHWWSFRALFDALPEETAIMRAIYWRSVDLSQFKGDALKNAKEMKRVYEIRDNTVDEQNAAVAAALMQGKDLAALL